MLRFERDALARFDLVLAVSEADGRTFERLYPGALRAPVHVVPTGVDTRYFTPQAAALARAHLVFTGSMDWLPNEDGMLYFVREILPRIRHSRAGRDAEHHRPCADAGGAAARREAGVEVTGRVDDVRPHIAAATSTSCRCGSAAARG